MEFQGLALLTLSAALFSLASSDCTLSKGEISACPPPSPFHVIFFFFSLYLVALGQGGHKPCVEAFGADQFDIRDPSKSKARSSFFNWWYVGVALGSVAAYMVLNYIQDYVSWAVAFGLQCTAMALALVVFMLGNKTYRHLVLEDKSPFARIAKVCFEFLRNRKTPTSTFDESGETLLLHEETQFESLDHKEEVISVNCHVSSPSKQVHSISNNSLTEEEVKGLVQLLPIWLACLIYGTVFAQTQTLFTKQGNTMERDVGFGYQIPAASLQLCSSIMVVVFVPIYDLVLVPIGRKFSGNPSGITMLQRIGIGMVFSTASMVSAGLVEVKRLKTARDFGLVDMPNLPVPMSVWWLVPQYVIFGISEAFTLIGMQEFFYDQMPCVLRSVGLALYLSICGVGSFLSSFLISMIDSFTLERGESWFANNINRAHLDYFFWLLAGLNFAGCLAFLHFARSYIYKKF
ncbi:protein NRT1/ PTR FAMILY 5.10-like isoform X2 [Phoenix dactylifera]|uniref:Protein NRT1/ PTR FAMILY 5.10-like isoform X2 n=1 Tax=Phoenix dactylifera TaxID=42345 RepID=A0A8B9AU85_PHODC|nr:protein NRT1/ PTR FAMILY 5.10-like isoform X2 [Phoenix dactylifera]